MTKNVQGRITARMAKSLFVGKGDFQVAAAYASAQHWSDAELVVVSLKGIVGALGTSDIAATPVAEDFSSAVRARSVLSRIPGLIEVPALTRLLTANVGGQADFVPEGGAIKLTKMELDADVLPELRCCGMMVTTEELMQSSSPSADGVISNDLIAAGAEAIDRNLLDPSNGGVPGERPASVFAGAHSSASTGSTFSQIDTDLTSALQYMVSVGSDLQNAVWCLRPETAVYLSALRDAAGALAYPGLTPIGGTLRGLPTIVSSAMLEPGSPPLGAIGLLDGSQLALVDSGAAQIAVSRNSTIQLVDDASSNSVSGSAANAVSLFQTNTVAIRTVQWVNWKLRRSAFAHLITGVAY